MKSTLQKLTPLLVVFAVLVSSSFIDAAWTAPSGSPSAGNNAPAPINVSNQNQIKSGAITAYDLNAGRFVWAGSQMRSPWYCDQFGGNCFTPSSVSAAAGPDIQSGTVNITRGARSSAVYVAFPRPFSAPPEVMITPKWARFTGDEDTTWWVTGVTQWGFVVRWHGPRSGGAVGGENGVMWMAVN